MTDDPQSPFSALCPPGLRLARGSPEALPVARGRSLQHLTDTTPYKARLSLPHDLRNPPGKCKRPNSCERRVRPLGFLGDVVHKGTTTRCLSASSGCSRSRASPAQPRCQRHHTGALKGSATRAAPASSRDPHTGNATGGLTGSGVGPRGLLGASVLRDITDARCRLGLWTCLWVACMRCL